MVACVSMVGATERSLVDPVGQEELGRSWVVVGGHEYRANMELLWPGGVTR